MTGASTRGNHKASAKAPVKTPAGAKGKGRRTMTIAGERIRPGESRDLRLKEIGRAHV